MKRFSGIISQFWSTKQSLEEEQGRQEIPIRILGARGAGKTTFLYKLYFKYCAEKPNDFQVLPTESHNVEVIPYGQFAFQIWEFADIGASLNYIKDTKVIIFMVDGVEQTKPAVAAKARENMLWILTTFEEELKEAIVITVVNKIDSEGAVDIQDLGQQWITDPLLTKSLRSHQWRIFECDAATERGLDKILDYLIQKIEIKSIQHTDHNIPLSPILPRSARRSDMFQRRASDSNHSSQEISYRRDLYPQAKMPVAPWEEVPNPYHLPDKEFWDWFVLAKAFLFFDHYSLLRIAYLNLLQDKQDTRRLLYSLRTILRGIELLEQDALRDAELANRRPEDLLHESIEYSETQTLFWIQMVSFGLLRHPVLDGEERDFESFLMGCPELWDGQGWKKYYSPKVYLSLKASQEFIPPDRKPLPNAFKASSLALRGSGLKIDYQVL
ncbi:P-loop containing nucleoside triphosphate hydrolase protein [Phycomyces nitens]|nr:P-loop containing nucleoside triphosphate hydrolase protein [Phycomyces nitens]